MAKILVNCLLVVCLAAWSHALLVKTKAVEKEDIDFEAFLTKTMQDYPAYLAQRDPTPEPPSSLVMKIESSTEEADKKLALKCDLTKQRMSGHSKGDDQTIVVSSLLASNFYAVSRYLRESYYFTGEFSCSGVRKADEEGQDDFSFSGNGRYFLYTNTSDETATFDHVEVTTDQKLNLESTVFKYDLGLTFSRRLLSGTWSDPKADNEYAEEIALEFQETYKRYLKDPIGYGISPLHPSLPLIESYLKSKTQNLDLTTITDPETSTEQSSTEGNPGTGSSTEGNPGTGSSTEGNPGTGSSTEGNPGTGSDQTTSQSETTTESGAIKTLNIGIWFTLAATLLTLL